MERLQQRARPGQRRGGRRGRHGQGPRQRQERSSTACTISEEARAGDREVLEEMVRGAVNQALAKVRQSWWPRRRRKWPSSLGLPPGMGLPEDAGRR